MTIEETEIEEIFKSLLQKYIKFTLGKKVVRRGKFILFKQNHFHIELMIETKNNKIKKFEIPIPFKIESWPNDNLVYCDYRLSTIAAGDKKLLKSLQDLIPVEKNKFYDTILEMEIIKQPKEQ